MTVREVIAEALDAARTLGEPDLVDLALQLQEASRSPKLRILIVGSTGSGRTSLAGAVLNRPDALEPTAVPRPPISITVRFGSGEEAVLHDKDGAAVAVPIGALRALLTEPNAADRYEAVELTLAADLLRTADLRIEAIEANRGVQEWDELFAETDYALVVLRASTLLSDAEKRFLRERLSPRLGMSRLAVVLNGIDLVPDDELDSLLELLDAFLGGVGGQTAVLPVSALRSRTLLLSGQEPDADLGGVIRLVEDLVSEARALRDTAIHSTLRLILDSLQAAAAGRETLLATRSGDIDQALTALDGRMEWLQGRIERAQTRIRSFVGTVLREEMMREVEAFATTMRQRLPDEVASIDDIALLRRHIAGYLEAVWSDFLAARLPLVRGRLLEEVEALQETVRRDIEDLIEGTGLDPEALLEGVNILSAAGEPFISPRRGRHPASNVAKGLSLQGLFLLVFNLPLGLLSLGAGQAVRRVYKGDIQKAERDAIAAAAVDAVRDIEGTVKRHVGTQLTEASEAMAEGTAAAYGEAFNRVRELVEAARRDSESLGARRAEVGTIAHDVLPRLRSALDTMEGAA